MSTRPERRLSPSFEPMVETLAAAPAGTPPPLRELLSEREEQIARLAARGLSNKEIGRRLRISPWTVATHLRRTFLKLEITRRIELCAFVAAIGLLGRERPPGARRDRIAAACRA